MIKPTFVDSKLRKSIEDRASICDQRTLALWAADCAEHVLRHFERKAPADDRPRRAIEAARVWVRGELPMARARRAAFAAHTAAREAGDAAAAAAARAAGHAAATAHAAAHAVHAATYAAKACAHASGPGVSAAADRVREWQLRRLAELYGGETI
ncbi:putative immunity protein [Paenibacillus humicola]|uniref:putative immunity protein n=1 Tax=Paenibacillus humicola TaxID=3110540 RepID=UPI00237AEFAF|nr:hypothetical protein [Paenibacillus humicola]